MVKPGEYYFVLSRTEMTYGELQDIFAGLGCVYARPLDGGDASGISFYPDQEELSPIVSSGTAGAVDFLYITEE